MSILLLITFINNRFICRQYKYVLNKGRGALNHSFLTKIKTSLAKLLDVETINYLTT
jgi:hypothetical protein